MGDDTLDGGAGVDTAVYVGPMSQYSITANGNGSYSLRDNGANGEGADTLWSIEYLRFSDTVVAMSSLFPGGSQFHSPSINNSSLSVTINENIGTTVEVYKVLGSDPDGTPLNYSISGDGDGAKFRINSLSGAVTFIASPDRENPGDIGRDNTYDITVLVSDGLNSTTKSITITVSDVNDNAPVITSLATASTAENIATTTAVYTAAATDADAGSTLTYSLVGGVDQAIFAINASTGVVTFKASPDYERPSDSGHDNVYNIQVQATDGQNIVSKEVAITVTNVAEIRALTSDLDGNAKSDIMLQNLGSGQYYVWSMNGKALLDSGFIGWQTGTDWQAKGTGDFNGDGKSDVVLQNIKDGGCYVWELNGKSLVDMGFVGWAAGPDWQVKATGDFNGDGCSDILLENSQSHARYIWEFNSKTLVDSGFVGWATNADWTVKATGDFNGDGKSDILLQNAIDGSCYVWEMDGLNLKAGGHGFVGWAPGKDWQVKGTGDFNGDGKSDILLQNARDGACYIWEMDGLTLKAGGTGSVGWTPGKEWQVAATGDYNGDHKSDILLHNANDGAYYLWQMDGLGLVPNGSDFVGWATGADWHVVA